MSCMPRGTCPPQLRFWPADLSPRSSLFAELPPLHGLLPLDPRREDVGGPQAESLRHFQAVVELAHVGVPAIGAEAELDPGRPGELQKTQPGALVAGADL